MGRFALVRGGPWTSGRERVRSLTDRGSSRQLLVAGAASVGVAFLLGVWIISPRFEIYAPSMADDWAGIAYAPTALDYLLEHGTPGEQLRYRPGFVVVWNMLQWHTLGAPDSVVGPNLWNLFRLALFVGALAAVPIAVLRSLGGSRGVFWIALLAALAPALVLASPMFGRDFARFGPQEPVLVGGMVAGAVLVVFAMRRWLGGISGRRQALLGVVLPALAGYALWLLGVYQKEASVCFLVLAPFLYLFLERRWREEGVIDRALARYRPVQVLGILLLLPVLHMAWVVGRLSRKERTVYDAPLPKTGDDWVSALQDAFLAQWRTFHGLTSAWRLGAALLVVLLVASLVLHRRVPWLALGLVSAGWAAFVFQGLGGTAASRYLIPTVALFAVAGVLLLADMPVWFRAPAVVVGILFVAVAAPRSHTIVDEWKDRELEYNRTVDAVADVDPERCPVYMAGFPPEMAHALPELVAVEEERSGGHCRRGRSHFLVQWLDSLARNQPIHQICAERWVPVRATTLAAVYRCPRVRTGRLAGPAGAAYPVARVLAEHRLTPGELPPPAFRT